MPQFIRRPLSDRLATGLGLLAVALGTFFIVRAERAYNQTYDESFHLAAGMEWLDPGTYYLEGLHPPLARVAVALLPYLDGMRGHTYAQMESVEPDETAAIHTKGWYEGNLLLNGPGGYWHNLLLERAGVLPFFWFSAFLIYRFMRRHFGLEHAVLALLLFCLSPPILANSAIATTDMPAATMYLWALLAFADLLASFTRRTLALAALSFACACLTKFTLIPFLLIADLLVLVSYAVASGTLRPYVRRILLTMVCVAPVIWAGYRFSVGPLLPAVWLQHHPNVAAQAAALSPQKRAIVTRMPVPAHEFFLGLSEAYKAGSGAEDRPAYLFGQTYRNGRWYFFPVALLTKTRIAVLLLCLFGLLPWLLERGRLRNHTMMLLAAGVLGPLLVAVPSKLNIGLRHILPVYPFLAMIAAIGAVWLLRSQTRFRSAATVLCVLLLGWSVETTCVASPEFLPYFNELAAPHAAGILVQSDLDWGQDLYQLEDRLKDVPPGSVYLSYYGDPRIVHHVSAGWHAMTPDLRPTGWVAISEADLQMDRNGYSWIFKYPSTEIGHSIRLYHFTQPPH